MKKRLLTTVAAGAVTLLALAGCASDNTGSGNNAGGDDTANSQTSGDKKDLTINAFSGWAEDIATSYLWQAILEDKGYNVKIETTTAGPGFTGVAQGDYDMNFDAWLPNTHKNYWDQYGDKLVKLGTWYENAPLTIAVNKDAPIDSLADLAANADKFDNRIVGIEPGAGETGVVKNSVIPAYGLEDMDFITSSTPAMLAELKKATKEGKNIAVTLWKPHWAYSAFPIKDLKDPKGALGEGDSIVAFGREGFKDDYPQLSKWLADFTFPDEQLFDLEAQLFHPADGDKPDESQYADIVDEGISNNQDWVDGLTA